MRKLFYKYCLSIGILLIFSLVSCHKNFLDREPSDFISSNEVFTNISNAEAFLDNAYNTLPDFQMWTEDHSGLYYVGDGTDEMGYQQSSFVTQTPFDFNNGNWNPVSFPMQHLWSDYYQVIRRINMFIENYSKIPEEVTANGSTSNLKETLLGQAYGLRAFFYFELFKMWGGVPILNTPINPSTSDDKLKRNSAEEVVDSIESDINKALALLPARYAISDYGRITSIACRALLSRLTLYYASPLWNPTNDKTRWTKAANDAKIALDSALANGYALSEGTVNGEQAYERIFLDPNSPEVIWSRQDNESQSFYWDYYMMPLSSGAWDVQGPLQEMVDAYEMTNGQLPVLGYDPNGNQIVNPKSGYDPQNPYINRDPRFYQSIIYPGATWQGRTINIEPGGQDYNTIGGIVRTDYWCKKYTLESHNIFTGSGYASRRFIIFRVAELYLNYAEAENEANGPDASVYSAINIIRERVGMPDIPTGLTQDSMRSRIQHERWVELAFEGQRFWDVRRWEIAENVDNGKVHKVMQDSDGKFSYPVFQTRVFDKSKDYLFPIPQSEIDKDHNLVQNPGW